MFLNFLVHVFFNLYCSAFSVIAFCLSPTTHSSEMIRFPTMITWLFSLSLDIPLCMDMHAISASNASTNTRFLFYFICLTITWFFRFDLYSVLAWYVLCSSRRPSKSIEFKSNVGSRNARSHIFDELLPIMICSSISNSTYANSQVSDSVLSFVWNWSKVSLCSWVALRVKVSFCFAMS
jgi:hypothetical protein